jgi:DNA repair photolyase
VLPTERLFARGEARTHLVDDIDGLVWEESVRDVATGELDGNPVAIVTKNLLVTRDIDLLADLARDNAAAVFLSVTTLNADLARIMEPRTAQPAARLRAIKELANAGVPVGVMVSPVIPGLTDHELPAIVNAAAEAGARFAGMVPLRLPYAVKDLFQQWLEQHMPDRKEKVLAQIRAMRGGKLNDSDFKTHMTGIGIVAAQASRSAGRSFRPLPSAVPPAGKWNCCNVVFPYRRAAFGPFLALLATGDKNAVQRIG